MDDPISFFCGCGPIYTNFEGLARGDERDLHK